MIEDDRVGTKNVPTLHFIKGHLVETPVNRRSTSHSSRRCPCLLACAHVFGRVGTLFVPTRMQRWNKIAVTAWAHKTCPPYDEQS